MADPMADGELLKASHTAHADLFWALRSGGGSFGIVTEFEFRLHPVGPLVAFVAPVYPIERARVALRVEVARAIENHRHG